MKRSEIPQDQSKALEGQRKPLYVVDDEGGYTTELSSGWEAEEVVLDLAIEQFAILKNDALLRAQKKMSSPLEYHMYCCRMDLMILSQSTGLFKWRIKRHFKPEIFSKLSDEFLYRYADVMGISVVELKGLPKQFSKTNGSSAQ